MFDLLTGPSRRIGSDHPAPANWGAQKEKTIFIGRTLRGPVGVPVKISHSREFRETFGGHWQGSPLSYAASLYFQNTDEPLWVLRLARNARGVSLDLPAQDGRMRLRARNPGRHEVLRAAVDFDGIAQTDRERRFNLTLQRLDRHGSSRILQQEIYPALAVDPDSDEFVGTALQRSSIFGLETPPRCAPYATAGDQTGGYRHANLDGDDGGIPLDEDYLGCANRRTGIFALLPEQGFSQVYLAPRSLDEDVGVTVLRTAARRCGRLNAMLIVDPPRGWRCVVDAEEGVRRMSLRNRNAALYFPRFWTSIAGQEAILVPPGGAVAGALARATAELGYAAAPAGQSIALRGIRRLAVPSEESECFRLGKLGINCLRRGRGGRQIIWDAHTLVDTESGSAAWQSLRVRRMALHLRRSLRRGLGWLGAGPVDSDVCRQVEAQVGEFLLHQFRAGQFRGATEASAFRAGCRLLTPKDGGPQLQLTLGFAPLTAGRFVELEMLFELIAVRARAVG